MADATKLSAKESVRQLQSEYDKLAAEGAGFEKKNATIAQNLRLEMNEKLKAGGADRSDLIARKSSVFTRLHLAKERRRKEIVAAVASGEMKSDDGEKEIVSLGWELAVARNDIQTAQAGKGPATPQHVETAAPTQRIVDPFTAGRPASREEKFEDPQKRTGK